MSLRFNINTDVNESEFEDIAQYYEITEQQVIYDLLGEIIILNRYDDLDMLFRRIVDVATCCWNIHYGKNNDDIDIIVIDIMMPNMDGYTAYKEIKKIKNIPTIILSARSDEYDKLMGFDLGIDDYMTKPFSPRELIARIKAIMKRDNKNTDIYQFQGLKIDKMAHSVYINDNEIELTPKEYEILLYFIDNKSIALSREQLLEKIWGYDFFGDDRTVDTHIKRIRQKISYDNSSWSIQTVYSVGYKFEVL